MVLHSINYIKTTSSSLKTWLNTVNQTYQSSSSHCVLHLLLIPLDFGLHAISDVVSLIIPSIYDTPSSNFLLVVLVTP